MAGVILDAGHGGYDNGAQYDGRKEKDDNLRLTLAVGQILEQNGVPVSYTRQSDIYQSPSEKQGLGMKVELIILSHFIEMQVQMRMNIKALKHWYLMIRGSKQRWQEM